MKLEEAKEILYKKRDAGEWTLNDYNAAMQFLDEIYEEGYVIIDVEIEGMKISVSTDYEKLKSKKLPRKHPYWEERMGKIKNHLSGKLPTPRWYLYLVLGYVGFSIGHFIRELVKCLVG